jgi:hypothetical protein
MATEKQRLTFISYSRTNRGFALELAMELKASGFQIWFDQLDIPTGARWDDEIEKALTQCEIFMVILTQQSIASNNVKDEIGYAIDSNKRILPILLEPVNVPFRLRRFQYVDFTDKSNNEGIEAAKQLLRKLMDEPTGPRPASVSADIPSPQPEVDRSAALKAEANRIARQKAEAIRNAQSQEQQKPLPQVVPAAPPTFEQKAPQQQTQRQSGLNTTLIIGGITLLSLFCLGGGWVAYRLLFPPTTSTPEIPTTEVPNVPFTWTPSHTPIGPTTITPTLTPTITTTPTVTPFAPQEPEQFINFYFEKIIYDKDYELGWSLLTPTFKNVNNPSGFEDWKATWAKVVAWDRPSWSVSYINSTTAIVSSPSVTFYSETQYSLPDRKYCLVRDETRNTWIIEHKGVCGF